MPAYILTEKQDMAGRFPYILFYLGRYSTAEVLFQIGERILCRKEEFSRGR